MAKNLRALGKIMRITNENNKKKYIKIFIG